MKKRSIGNLHFKKAVTGDAKAIHKLINTYAEKNKMLPRSLNEIYENIRDYLICLDNGSIIAVSSLHILWEDLAEIRSVSVSKKYQGRGIGKKLISKGLKEAKSIGVKKVFALTYHPDYFKILGFEDIDKNNLPHKIWVDCLKCPKFPDCNETAVIKYLEV